MKEFALKHPFLTFLLADTLICGVLNTIAAFAGSKKEEPAENENTEKAVDCEEEAE